MSQRSNEVDLSAYAIWSDKNSDTIRDELVEKVAGERLPVADHIVRLIHIDAMSALVLHRLIDLA